MNEPLHPEGRHSIPSEPRLGVALIGVGRWGQHWARTLARSAAVRLLWACDTAARCELPGETTWTADYRECLADSRVEAVVLATPLETHASLGLEVLRSGRHLLVEKPATTRLADLEALLHLAASVERVVMANHLLLHHPAFARLEQALADGEIGSLRSITAIRISQGNRPNESAWWTLAPHDLALIDRMAPSLLEAQPRHGRRGPEHRVMLRHRDVEAELVLSLCGREKVRLFAVSGTRGSLLFDDLAPHPLTLHGARLGMPGADAADAQELRARLGKGRPLPLGEGMPLERALAEFCARVRRRDGTSDAEAAHLLRVVRALELGGAFGVLERPSSVEVPL